MSAALLVECPYCGLAHRRRIATPPLPRVRREGETHQLTPIPVETATVPYVRDVGRFDPRTAAEWDDEHRGGWVGSDFLPALRFDQWVGILVADGGRWPRVWYRVERCPHCLHHFDAYYSFHPERSLAEQFPHLFAAEGKLLDMPRQEPLPLAIVDRLRPTSTGGIRGLVATAAVWWVLGAAAMALVRIMTDRFLLVEYVVTSGSLLLGLAGAVVLLRVLQTFLPQLSTDSMDEVIRCDYPRDRSLLRRRNRVSHWVSFTRCRYTGRPVQGRVLRTTTDLLGGVIAVVTLVGAVLVSGDPSLDVVATRLFDAVWWLPVAYVLGSSLQLAATTVHYVLAGLTRVPLRLDHFDPTGDLRVLRAIQRYVRATGTTVAVLLVVLLAANAALRGPDTEGPPLAWVDVWFLLIVAVGMLCLGFTHEPSYLVLALIAGSVVVALRDAGGFDLPFLPGLPLQPVTLWLGLVFTAMLVAETRTTNRLVEVALRNTVEARAVRLLRNVGEVSQEEVLKGSAAIGAARAVIEMRAGVGASPAWVPLAASVTLPAALEGIVAAVAGL